MTSDASGTVTRDSQAGLSQISEWLASWITIRRRRPEEERSQQSAFNRRWHPGVGGY